MGRLVEQEASESAKTNRSFLCPVRSQFLDYADEIARSGATNARNSYLVLESFSRTVTSLVLFSNASLPLFTIPHFESRATDYRTVAEAESLTFAPVVPDSHREAYEAYTVENQKWIQEGLDHEYMKQLLQKERDATRGEADLATTRSGEPIAPGTNAEGFSLLNKAKPIQPFIWRNAALTNRAVPDRAKGPHLPIWQTYPAPRNSYVVGHNLQTIPAFAELIASSKETYMPTLSDFFDNFVLFGNAQTIDVDPKSVLMQPIFSTIVEVNEVGGINKDRVDIVGFMVVIKKWNKIFQNVLYNGAEPVVVVLRNTCGKAFTYRIMGPAVEFLGQGDLHDTHYDSMEVMASLSNQDLVVSSCNFTMHAYPTTEMEDAYLTSTPIFVAMAVLCVFILTSLIFLLYDWTVSRRQKSVVSAAQATSRIVANLFPKAVRERMIHDIKTEEKRASNFAMAITSDSNDSVGASSSHDNRSGLWAGSNHGKNKDKKEPASDRAGATSEDIFGSKPIAELFPATTIMCKFFFLLTLNLLTMIRALEER